jgi:hypothetical protein
MQRRRNSLGHKLMVFFLQRRIQPLQHRITKLWTYSGSSDPSQVSQKDPEKKDLDKRVRSLTPTLQKIAVPACLATPFDSTHPLPKVSWLVTRWDILISCVILSTDCWFIVCILW